MRFRGGRECIALLRVEEAISPRGRPARPAPTPGAGLPHVGGTLNTLAVERACFAAADTHALKLQALTVKKGGVAQRTATHAYDTVTVNGQSAYRRGEYFWKELGVANASAPVATAVTVSAGGTPTTGKLVTPPAAQSFVHDLDGNLTDDGVWTYTWDAENRLAGMQHKTTLADPAARRKLAFEYDARGRRIRKQVFPWGSTDYSATATSDQRYVYDGWNLLAIFDPQFSILQSFVWGLDLSGTAQGAGGVGGLLAAITGTTAQFAAYDGNGNVRALADGGTGAWSAQYEYGPFGELVRATGPQAKANPFRFSTKWHDDESDLLYYGYRYYQPGTGRWISRDPIEENGGLSLYVLLRNDSLHSVDNLGLEQAKDETHFRPPLFFLPPDPTFISACAFRVYKETMPVWCKGGLKDNVIADRGCGRAHCIANCRISRECPQGLGVALLASWLKENFNPDTWKFDLWKGDPDSIGDMKANALGRFCAPVLWMSCERLCKNANKLY